MKTLILSCDMGGEHNSAAKALAQWGGRNGIECETADTLSFISTDFSKTMSDLYIFTTKSNLIKVIYKTGEIVPRSRRAKFPVYVANKIYCKRLIKDFGGEPNVHSIGFTDRVPLLMDACDVLFTKPGGLSSTEAAAKRIPLIHTAPIPGCETDNARFFHYHGMSYSTTDTAQQAAVARLLCTDQKFRESMTAAQTANTFPDTSEQIFNLLR